MKKISNAGELLWLFGNIFVALGVAICSKANLGVSMIAAPAFVVFDAIAPFSKLLSVGVIEYIIQGFILVLLCAIVRRFNWRYLFAFAVAVIYGYILNFFLWILGGIEVNAVWIRWVMLVVGDICTAFGVACFFRTYMPLQVYELFVAEASDRFHVNINVMKWIFDISLLVLTIVLAVVLFGKDGSFDWSTIGNSSFHSIGLGTIVTTAINSPIISLMGLLIDRYFDKSPKFLRIAIFFKGKRNVD
ncbi:MAG: DUF6198 family protein [bacterium]|nr:DUF6198 family protein [bacterium]